MAGVQTYRFWEIRLTQRADGQWQGQAHDTLLCHPDLLTILFHGTGAERRATAALMNTIDRIQGLRP
jgi:hypothetical protein